MVAGALRRWQMDGNVPSVELVVSELLAQAVRRGGGEIGVRVVVTGDHVQVEVDETAFAPSEAGPLWFVDEVAAAWGRRRQTGRTVTWATCARVAGADVA